MDLITPGIGLVFWTVVIFAILLIGLKKLAWPHILSAVKEREESIKNALASAEKAKEEMSKLQAGNEKIIARAKEEKEILLKEAREIKDSMIKEAKKNASEEANKIIENARQSIENEKASAINEIKNQVAILSVKIAEKILQQKLSGDKSQKELLENLLKNIKLN